MTFSKQLQKQNPTNDCDWIVKNIKEKDRKKAFNAYLTKKEVTSFYTIVKMILNNLKNK